MSDRLMKATGLVVIGLMASMALAPDPQALKVQGPDSLGNALPIQIAPTGAVGLTRTELTSSANAANASNAATLPAGAGVFTYITGFEVNASGATAALAVDVTVTGTIGGTLHYSFVFPLGVTVGATPLIVEFPYPIPSAAPNTAIVVTLPAGGAGNTNASVVAHGFRQ